MYCKYCGKQAADDSKFCPHCGKALSKENHNTCASCGTELPEGASFCPACGATTRRNKLRPWVIIAGVAVCILIFIIAPIIARHSADDKKTKDPDLSALLKELQENDTSNKSAAASSNADKTTDSTDDLRDTEKNPPETTPPKASETDKTDNQNSDADKTDNKNSDIDETNNKNSDTDKMDNPSSDTDKTDDKSSDADKTNTTDTKENTSNQQQVLATDYYTLTLPSDWTGAYEYEIIKDPQGYPTYTLVVYDAVSKNTSYGGELFAIAMYYNESDYINDPKYKVLGRLAIRQADVFDVVVLYPTDVQYNTDDCDSYKQLQAEIDQVLESFTPDSRYSYYPAS